MGTEFGDHIDGVEAVGLAMLAWTLGYVLLVGSCGFTSISKFP